MSPSTFQNIGIVKNNVMVEFVDLDEGWNGGFNPDDPDDEHLLRFDVSRHNRKTNEWEAVDDASYCTQIPLGTDEPLLFNLLQVIMSEVFEPVSNGHSIKKICERLSWIDSEGNY